MDRFFKGSVGILLALTFAAAPFVMYGMLLRLGYSLMGGILRLLKGLAAEPEILLLLLLAAALLWLQLAFAHTQYRLLQLCSAENRAMRPGRVWFILIPYIGQIIGIFVVNALSKSTESEFTFRQVARPPAVASFAGYVVFAASLLSLTPIRTASYDFILVGFYAISLVIYWRSVRRCRRALQPALAMPPA